jgi:hypothetical protein
MALSSKTPAINMKNGAFDNFASIGWMAVVAVDAIGNDKSAGTFLHVINKATTASRAMGLTVIGLSTDR